MKISEPLRAMSLALALGLVPADAAYASVIASDTFAYPTAAPLATNNGGAGWGGAWGASGANTVSTVIDSSANPLTFTPSGGSTISGGNEALQVQLAAATAGNEIAGARQFSSALTSTFYVGYLFRFDGSDFSGSATAPAYNNTFTLHLSSNATSTASINFGVRGDASTANEFLVRSGTGAPVAGASAGGQLVNGAEYFFVAKMTYSGTNFNQADVWINPDAVDPTPDMSLTLSTGALTSITHAFFRQAANQNSTDTGTADAVLGADIYIADGLIIGTTWEDVVGMAAIPEPSAFLMVAAGGLAIFAMRRRS